MALFSIGEKRRWGWAAGGAGIIVVLGVALFRGPTSSPDAVAAGNAREVTLIRPQDTTVNDEAALLDPTPLFLPTKWNSTQRAIAPREAGGKFQGFDTPKWNFAENDLKLGLPAPIAVPVSAAEAVAADAPQVPLVGLGREDGEVTAPPERRGFVTVADAASGRVVLPQIVQEGPQLAGAWQPLEFIAGVDAAGLVGPLVLTARSGADEVDGFFANYLVRTLRLGERLGPGFYRITIGP